MVENIHNGVHPAKSQAIQGLDISVITAIGKIYRRGLASGVFRPGVDEIDVHMTISALCFFNVANRSTFSQIFKRDMQTPEALARRRAIMIDAVARYVRADRGPEDQAG